ncbi:MAG: hypothetical protein ACYTGB_02365 [Planctomycetota bacterium]|jgi:hypothetical protein
MRRAAAVLVILAFPAGLLAGEVTLARKAPAVGSVRTVTQSSDTEIKLVVSMEGKTVQTSAQKESKTVKRVEEVLVVKDGAPVKVKVSFPEASSMLKPPDGGEVTKVPAHRGKTYLAEAGEKGISVTYADGGQPPPAEVEAVRESCGSLGKVDPLSKFFDGRKLVPGEKIDCPKEVTDQIFAGGGGGPVKVETFSFVFREMREVDGAQCAALDTSLVMSGKPSPDLSMKMTFKGEVLIRADCMPVGMALEGKVEMSGGNPKANVVLSGSGPAKITIKAEYAKPK